MSQKTSHRPDIAEPTRVDRDSRERPSAVELQELVAQLAGIRDELLQTTDEWDPWVSGREANRDASARNLLQYLTLRGHDLRDLQNPLIALGLSSLGGSEGHVQATVDAVLAALIALSGRSATQESPAPPIGFAQSRELLAERTDALLGPAHRRRSTRILVTMPTEAATQPRLVSEMLQAGMDCVRINCAHDSPAQWRATLANLHRAEAEVGRRARVLVDLPGPKFRTGQLSPGQARDRKGDYLRLQVGDSLILAREQPSDDEAQPGTPRIGCSPAAVFDAAEVGHRVWLDDGKLGGVIERVDRSAIQLRITDAGPKGAKLRSGKGINLPDATFDADILGPHSEGALGFALEAADMIGLSFVSHPQEVKRVSKYLDARGRPDMGMVLKIETRSAFERLPGMLLAALGSGRPAGVMIARGDLAVDCGYQRLAELQEEILWLCQAAHLPVIWATEVLDRLAKTGRPSRAEITDAAMGIQAECVMLNKGPRIIEAIETLDDILRRMQRHHRKKQPLLPYLSASDYLPTR